MMFQKTFLFTICALLLNCSPKKRKDIEKKFPKETKSTEFVESLWNVKVIPQKKYYPPNQEFEISIDLKNKKIKKDSIVLFRGRNIIRDIQPIMDSHVIKVLPNDFNTGENVIRCVLYFENGKSRTKNIKMSILSDIVPEKYSYQIISVVNHNIESYTQGLVYEEGYLYEGTGSWGKSKLLKFNTNTWEQVSQIKLDNDLFGEGIAIYENKIVQLTWKANVGFVYDKNNFKLLQKVYYESREGWGITYDGQQFIMSDGTNLLYFLDKQYFTEIKRIEVFDNLGPVSSLNELEYVEGEVYANVYGTDEIVSIDAETGKVLKRINLKGILDQTDYHDQIDVLNGIAYNAVNNHFYVTGKNWPKLFEVKFLPK